MCDQVSFDAFALLIGYRLVRGAYEKIEPRDDDTIVSRELGILFTLDGSELVMKSAATGELVLSSEEITQVAEQRAEEEHQRAEEEHQRAEQAERRLAKLTAEIARLRQELGRKPNGKAKP